MNVVDSSAWLAFFEGSKNADYFAPAIEDLQCLLVPTITLTEVFKVVARQRDAHQAAIAVAHMQQGRLVELDESVAIRAADCALRYHLPLADSIVYASALARGAIVWTQDSDFEQLPGVNFRSALPRNIQ